LTIITPDYGQNGASCESGIHIERYPFRRLPGIGKQLPHRYFSLPWVISTIEQAIVTSVRKNKIEVLHAQTLLDIVPTESAAKRCGIPFVAHVRDSSPLCCHGGACLMKRGVDTPPWHCGWEQNLICMVERELGTPWGLKYAARIAMKLSVLLWDYTVLHRRIQSYSRATRIAFQSPRLSALYSHTKNFSDTSKHRTTFGPSEGDAEIMCGDPDKDLPEEVADIRRRGDPIILYVGKVSLGKGADVLFASHRLVLQKEPNAWLVVAGNVHNADQWSPVKERTVFTGFVGRKEVGALYKSATVVVMPSTWPEPMGWPVQDSCRFGKPLVATRVGGVAGGVIDGKTGFLVNKLDELALANRVLTLIENPKLCEQIGDAAMQHGKAIFGNLSINKQLEELYK